MPSNQENQPPAIPSLNNRDLLSFNLGTLSQNLVTLDLSGIFSTDIFSHEFHWPHLQTLQLWIFMCTPSGNWMIEKDPEDSETELIFDAFFLAAGKAVARMPKMLSIIVLSEPWVFEFEYSSNGYSKGCVEWQTLATFKADPPTYQPGDEVIEAWKDAVATRQGDLKVSIKGTRD
jgi:hypothetical protein